MPTLRLRLRNAFTTLKHTRIVQRLREYPWGCWLERHLPDEMLIVEKREMFVRCTICQRRTEGVRVR